MRLACSMRVGMTVAAVIACMALSGCMVGPDFRRPEDQKTSAYTSTPLPEKTDSAPGTAGTAQRFVSAREIPAQWWEVFHSEPLDRLIRLALAENPTVAAAQASLRQARENLRAVTGVLYPEVNANVSVTREKITNANFGQTGVSNTFNLYNASVGVSYGLDLFGGARRELESQSAQIQYQSFLVEGTYLALTANIVTAAVKEASLRAQIQATQDIVAAQAKQLEVVERQLQIGSVAQSDVLAQRTQLSQTRATLPPLELDLAQTRHLLAVLTGKLPSEAQLPEFTLDGIQLPPDIPVSLPSELARQRPDIRASEELLHSASAEVGVATANLYPKISLSGSVGPGTVKFGDLFNGNSTIWSLGANVMYPVFHGGTLSAQRDAAIASYERAVAQYRVTILQAFQNVADVLRALDFDAHLLKAQSDAAADAHASLDLTQKQFQVGAVSYLLLLNAERQYHQTRIALAQAQAARLADTAALFQALGGGWWNRPPQTVIPVAGKKD